MKTIPFHLVILTLLSSYACNTNSSSTETSTPIASNSDMDLSKGFTLTENYCFTCLSPNASIDNRIAPPMVAIKKHYISENTSEEDFLKAIIHFVNNPSEDISKMPGAVAKFNLMPKMSYSEEDLKQIAHYIYNTEIEQPEWFEEHYQQEKKKYSQQANTEVLTDIEQGKKYALGTKAILGKNLLGAINEKGTTEALTFCNTKAIHLTDSMATEQGVKIKRVSDLERNPNNKANAEELKHILAMKEQLAKGEEAKAILIENANNMIGYYPITTNAMCLQCHGGNTEISKETQLAIDALYPNDKATGYGENELRGIWVVEMIKK